MAPLRSDLIATLPLRSRSSSSTLNSAVKWVVIVSKRSTRISDTTGCITAHTPGRSAEALQDRRKRPGQKRQIPISPRCQLSLSSSKLLPRQIHSIKSDVSTSVRIRIWLIIKANRQDVETVSDRLSNKRPCHECAELIHRSAVSASSETHRSVSFLGNAPFVRFWGFPRTENYSKKSVKERVGGGTDCSFPSNAFPGDLSGFVDYFICVYASGISRGLNERGYYK